MTEVEMLVAALGRGRENAKKRRQLSQDLGMSDRRMRKLIELAQQEGYPVINFQDGAGYSLAADDRELVRYQRQEIARANAIIRKARKMEVCYGNIIDGCAVGN